MARAVARYFPEGTRLTRPDGGYLLWVQLPGGTSALGVYREAMNAKILVVPGEICSSTGRFRDCLRLSCAHPWSEGLDRAMRTLGRICHDIREVDSSKRGVVSYGS
jgi:DNA-binding transcriptional MocR family regulator